MKEYKLKTGKLGKKIINIYEKIEHTVVGCYKSIETKFVEKFLEEKE